MPHSLRCDGASATYTLPWSAFVSCCAAGLPVEAREVARTGYVMRKTRRSTILGLVGLGLSAVVAGAADLDSTFGVRGKVITDVSGRYDEIRALAIQPDGRIVAAGV